MVCGWEYLQNILAQSGALLRSVGKAQYKRELEETLL